MSMRNLSINVVLAAALIGCGGSSSNDPVNSGSDVPVSSGSPTDNAAPVSVKGKIDAFGSVVVGGIHYDTDDAEIYINGELSTEENLDLGQIVEIIGEIDEDSGEGVASRIEYLTDVQGPISDFNSQTGEITILGQTVLIDEDLLELVGFNLEDIDEGLSVEVSGHRDEMGNIVATFIELIDSDEEIIRGEITNIDLDNLTIEVNGQTVSIADLVNIAIEDLIEGDDLFVIGDLDGDVLIPDGDIDFDDFFDDIDVDTEIEIEGVVTEVVNETDFVMNGLTFRITEDTEFDNGSPSDLVVGRLIEVEGEFTESDIVLAESIDFDQETDLELEGIVESVDPDNNQFVMFGLTFHTNENTVWEDDSDADIRDFSISDIAAGDYLVVDVVTLFDDPIRFEVKKVEREDLDFDDTFFSEVFLIAQVEAFDNNTLTLTNGIELLITESTDLSELGDTPDLSSLTGTLVEIEAHYEENNLVADSVELAEDCDVSQNSTVQSNDISSVSNNLSLQVYCVDDLDDEDEDEDEDEFDDDAIEV